MKTTLHYLLTILLLSLATVHARAATGDEGPFKITDVKGVTPQYNADTTLLTISGGGSLTITGDGKPVNCGIIFEAALAVSLKIKNLHIRTDAPLLTKTNIGGVIYTLELEGTNILEATAGSAIHNQNNIFQIIGNGSLTLRGAENASAMVSTNGINKNGNNILIAIDGKGANSSPLVSNAGLFLHGKVNDTDVIEQVSSELKGDLTIDHDFEIPEWASINVARGQTLTIANGVTLTNNGTIINNGTINGTLAGNPVNTIGKEDGFTIEPDQYVGLEYDSEKKLLTINGLGELTITGQGKPVNCGIVIAEPATVTMKDIYLQSEIPLTAKVNADGGSSKIILQGINRLESNAAVKQPGMLLSSVVDIHGPGSLTVKGSESGGVGIDYIGLRFRNEAFVVAIGGEGAVGAENGSIDEDNGLLISGSLQEGGTSIQQNYSKLIGNFTLYTNTEIPEWATVTIPANQSITITENVTLTNQGTLTLEDNSTLTNQGTLTLEDNSTLTNRGRIMNHGTISSERVTVNPPEHFVTFKPNYNASGTSIEQYVKHGSEPSYDGFTREGYTLGGWYDAPNGGTKVTTITNPQTVYAHWKDKNAKPDPVPPPPMYRSITTSPCLKWKVRRPIPKPAFTRWRHGTLSAST